MVQSAAELPARPHVRGPFCAPSSLGASPANSSPSGSVADEAERADAPAEPDILEALRDLTRRRDQLRLIDRQLSELMTGFMAQLRAGASSASPSDARDGLATGWPPDQRRQLHEQLLLDRRGLAWAQQVDAGAPQAVDLTTLAGDDGDSDASEAPPARPKRQLEPDTQRATVSYNLKKMRLLGVARPPSMAVGEEAQQASAPAAASPEDASWPRVQTGGAAGAFAVQHPVIRRVRPLEPAAELADQQSLAAAAANAQQQQQLQQQQQQQQQQQLNLQALEYIRRQLAAASSSLAAASPECPPLLTYNGPSLRLAADAQPLLAGAGADFRTLAAPQLQALHNLQRHQQQQQQQLQLQLAPLQAIQAQQQRLLVGADQTLPACATNAGHQPATKLEELTQSALHADRLAAHQHHQRLVQRMSFRCHVCGSGFEDRHRLQQHLSIHLNLNPSWFEEKTIKETMAQYELRRGDYLCRQCQFRFDTTAEFDRHMQLHGEKPHQCELCRRDNKLVSFRFFRQLLTHLRSHCFLYSCKFNAECKQTANRKDYLKLHILKHHLNNKLPEQYTICCH